MLPMDCSRVAERAEAALSLSRQFAMSRRQAYRYIEEGPDDRPTAPVMEPATAVTFKLPPVWSIRFDRGPRQRGRRISDMVSRALRAFLAKPAAMAERRRTNDRSVISSKPSTVSSPPSWSRSMGFWSRNRSVSSVPQDRA